MAGMFYSLQEVIEKLNRTEEEIRELVKQGSLREFRDGPNLLFKIDEVEALLSDTSFAAPQAKQEKEDQEVPIVSEAGEDSRSGWKRRYKRFRGRSGSGTELRRGLA